MWYIVLILFLLITGIIWTFPSFGQSPVGARKERINTLPNFDNGELKNLSPTPIKPDQLSYFDMVRVFFFKKHPNRRPLESLPILRSEFSKSNEPKITWFGHSSYLLQLNELNILVDPLFNDRPSPFKNIGTKPFKGTDVITVDSLPEIDLILLTHDHYDHLSYRTIKNLKYLTAPFICALGVGAHLEKWGIPPANINELTWNERVNFKGIEFIATPARHFSGRRFKRNQTVWAGFVIETGEFKVYVGGDSGYDTHFKAIGNQFGPFDLVILECGQYNEMWPLIHMMPEEMLVAATELGAKIVLPVHWGKFSLAMHPWKEPIERAYLASKEQNIHMITPRIGETIVIGVDFPKTTWWRNIS